MRRLWLFIILIGMIGMATTVLAQGAPDQIDIALDRLSAEVNQTVTINDLSNWRWAQDLYPDVSLGCPQPDTAYAEVATVGFKFLLTYQGVIYDYRVAAGGNIAILCSQVGETDLTAATPTPMGLTAVDTSVVCLDPEPGVVYLSSRLTNEMQARVVDGPPIIQRIGPSDNDAVVGEIAGGGIVTVGAGPVCADGQIWWQVDFDGQVGWTVEGRDGSYWLEIVPALALPPNLPLLASANAGQVSELSQAQNNVAGALALAPASPMVAVLGGSGTNGVWLYNLAALDTTPSLLRGTTQLTDIAYSPGGDLLLLGDASGSIRLWSTDPGAALLERWFDQSHEKLTTAVAFAPNGQTVASVGDVAVTDSPVFKNNAILLWNIDSVAQTFALGGHAATVHALAFSPDGALLASGGDDIAVRLWNPVDGSSLAVLDGHPAPIMALAFSPDGRTLASAGSDGTIILWDVAARAQTRVLQASGTATAALVFSPDGALLASAGGDDATGDYAIRLWDAASGDELARLGGHTDTVSDLAFSADGRLLVSVSADKSARFWGVG